MKLTVAIDDETQLKKDIKDMVDAFIRQYAREEAQTILLDELKRVLTDKIKNFDENKVSRYITDILTSKLKDTLGGSWYSSELVKKETVALVEKITKEQLEKINFLKLATDSLTVITTNLKNEFIKKLLDK